VNDAHFQSYAVLDQILYGSSILDILRIPSMQGKIRLLSIWGVNQAEQNRAETATLTPSYLAMWFSLLDGFAKGVCLTCWSF